MSNEHLLIAGGILLALYLNRAKIAAWFARPAAPEPTPGPIVAHYVGPAIAQPADPIALAAQLHQVVERQGQALAITRHVTGMIEDQAKTFVPSYAPPAPAAPAPTTPPKD